MFLFYTLSKLGLEIELTLGALSFVCSNLVTELSNAYWVLGGLGAVGLGCGWRCVVGVAGVVCKE